MLGWSNNFVNLSNIRYKQHNTIHAVNLSSLEMFSPVDYSYQHWGWHFTWDVTLIWELRLAYLYDFSSWAQYLVVGVYWNYDNLSFFFRIRISRFGFWFNFVNLFCSSFSQFQVSSFICISKIVIVNFLAMFRWKEFNIMRIYSYRYSGLVVPRMRLALSNGLNGAGASHLFTWGQKQI
jgi:hypothetical protein